MIARVIVEDSDGYILSFRNYYIDEYMGYKEGLKDAVESDNYKEFFDKNDLKYSEVD